MKRYDRGLWPRVLGPAMVMLVALAPTGTASGQEETGYATAGVPVFEGEADAVCGYFKITNRKASHL